MAKIIQMPTETGVIEINKGDVLDDEKFNFILAKLLELQDLKSDFLWLFENSNVNMDVMRGPRIIEINDRYNQLKNA